MILIIPIYYHRFSSASLSLYPHLSTLWIKLFHMLIHIWRVRKFYDFSCDKQCKAEDKISTLGVGVLEEHIYKMLANQAVEGKLAYQAATLLSANWCLYGRSLLKPCLAANRSYCPVSFWIQRSLQSVVLNVSLMPFLIKTDYCTEDLNLMHLSFCFLF